MDNNQKKIADDDLFYQVIKDVLGITSQDALTEFLCQLNMVDLHKLKEQLKEYPTVYARLITYCIKTIVDATFDNYEFIPLSDQCTSITINTSIRN